MDGAWCFSNAEPPRIAVRCAAPRSTTISHDLWLLWLRAPHWLLVQVSYPFHSRTAVTLQPLLSHHSSPFSSSISPGCMFSSVSRALRTKHSQVPVVANTAAAALAGALGATALFHHDTNVRATARMAEDAASSTAAFSPKARCRRHLHQC